MKTRLTIVIGAALLVLLFLLALPDGRLPSPGQETDEGSPPTKPTPDSSETASKPPSIPPSVQPILGREGENHQKRRQAVRQLEPQLTKSEQESLREFLLSPTVPVPPNQTLMAEAAIRNNVLNRLKKASPLSIFLTELLISIVEDEENQHPVMRDYALQHMASWYQRLGENVPDIQSEEVAAQKAAIHATLKGALTETEGSLPATALLSLDRIRSSSNLSAPSADIGEAALGLLKNPEATDLVKRCLKPTRRVGRHGNAPWGRLAAQA